MTDSDDKYLKLIEDVPKSLTMSREYALLGAYDTSLIYFDAVMKQMDQYIGTLHEPDKRKRWLATKNELQEEFKIVKELQYEVTSLKNIPKSNMKSSSPSSVSPGGTTATTTSQYGVSPTTPVVASASSRRPRTGNKSNSKSPPMISDPDVWPPPTAGPRSSSNEKNKNPLSTNKKHQQTPLW